MTATVPPSTGADPSATDTRHRKVAIIGSGPAGLTAAIYAARANLEPIVLAGNAPMGQLMITSDVENYPGFPEGIMGPELMAAVPRAGRALRLDDPRRDVTRVDFSERPVPALGRRRRVSRRRRHRRDRRIRPLAGPADPRRSSADAACRACATCDGFFFRGREIAVVGGGDTALEEAPS